MSVKESIEEHAVALSDSIIKVDTILNHLVEPNFIAQVVDEFIDEIEANKISNISKILTVEASGIAPAFALASRLCVPLVYARRGKRITMPEVVYRENVQSRTSATSTGIVVSSDVIKQKDNILIVDDFLGSGGAASAAGRIIQSAGAGLLGFCFVVEKTFEQGRSALSVFEVPIISLCTVSIEGKKVLVS